MQQSELEALLNDLRSVLVNLVADLIGASMVWIVVIILVVAASAAHRRRQVRFFGVRRSTKSVVVYLSSLNVKPYGSLGPDGNEAGFYGQATPGYELDAVVPFIGIWRNNRLDRLSASTRRRVAAAWWPLSDVTPTLLACPDDPSKLHPEGTIVSIGGPAYNTCTMYLFDVIALPLRIGEGLSVDRFEQGSVVESWDFVGTSPHGGAIDYAIVERFTNRDSMTTYFVAAGLTKVGTTGAAAFLAAHWRDLGRLYGSDDFSICLQFQRVFVDPAAYLRGEVMYSSEAVTRRYAFPGWQHRTWARISRSPSKAVPAQLSRYTELEYERPSIAREEE